MARNSYPRGSWRRWPHFRRNRSLMQFLSIALLHTEAAPSGVPRDVVMQTIRNYGRGHEGTPAPAPWAVPDTSDASCRIDIERLLHQENYGQLEKIAEINRARSGKAGDSGRKPVRSSTRSHLSGQRINRALVAKYAPRHDFPKRIISVTACYQRLSDGAACFNLPMVCNRLQD